MQKVGGFVLLPHGLRRQRACTAADLWHRLQCGLLCDPQTSGRASLVLDAFDAVALSWHGMVCLSFDCRGRLALMIVASTALGS